LLFVSALASAAPLALSISVEPSEFAAGSWPSFVVTLTNTSTEPIRVLNFDARRDLQDAYLPIKITDGRDVLSLPRAISDPGPLSKDAIVVLAPNSSTTLKLSTIAPAVHLLKPGRYVAVVEYRAPEFFITPYPSSANVAFRVY
jgi:hypothetical protein